MKNKPKLSHTFKIAAMADIHVKETTQPGTYKSIFDMMQQEDEVDALLVCGDICDLGRLEEAEIFCAELADFRPPVLIILGNHDYHSDIESEIAKKFIEHRFTVLEGQEYILEKDNKKLGFTGVKGFGGGFLPSMWGRFGEREQKAFYDACEIELEQLELGLNRLRGLEPDFTIVGMHYSPIRATIDGEIPELIAFLGSSRFEEVINRYEHINAVIHGHSHFGTPKGKTDKGVPVYNVAYNIMQKLNPDKPYLVLEF